MVRNTTVGWFETFVTDKYFPFCRLGSQDVKVGVQGSFENLPTLDQSLSDGQWH